MEGIIFGAVGALAAISGIIIGWLGQGRAAKSVIKAEAKSEAFLQTDVEYIKRGIDDIRVEQRAMREDNAKIKDRVTAVEGRAEEAHRRIDELTQKGRGA